METPSQSATDTFLSGLNSQQRKAVVHGGGPLLIIAGAGSGKTRTLAYRVAYLISRGVKPERILLCSFTRRAAQEMLRRAAAILSGGAPVTRRVWGGTFHSVGNRLVRVYAKSAGLPPDFTILDQSDAQDLLNIIRHDLGFSNKESRFPRKSTCLAVYSRRMNGLETLDEVLKKYFPWCETWKKELGILFKEYVQRKQAQHVLDYDDLLHYWYQLLQIPAIAESIGNRFDHILVDEYQDTNRIQANILRAMRGKNTNITVVGDDAQSIYSFRAATIRNILDFPKCFPETTVITLDQNYRSLSPILETTNRVIQQARERFSKALWSTRGEGDCPRLITCSDEDHECRVIIDQVLQHHEEGIPLREQAVLFRAASHSTALELELTRRKIPFHKYGGMRFLEAAHIKDVTAFLRIGENPHDRLAWFRVLLLLSGIGPSTAARVFDRISSSSSAHAALKSFDPPRKARSEYTDLVTLFEELGKDAVADVAVHINRIRRFYEPILKRSYENAEARRADIEHLEQLAAGYSSREKFLTELVLDPPTSTSEFAAAANAGADDYLVLSTIHSAKGCEWDVVYLMHATDGCLPSDRSCDDDNDLEEELRLTYVALTRACDHLYVTWPLRFYHRPAGMTDYYSFVQCCRFFTDEVKKTMEVVGAPAEHGDDMDEHFPGESGTTIGDRILDMWD